MATKDPLKKLMRRFPAPDELDETLNTLGQGDDRTIAIVGASILEAILERFIKRRLRSCDKVLASQLFENRGPLSDFHGKIVVAQACGYITQPMAKELQLVKSIRNAFAHAVVGVSFDTPEVDQKVMDSLIIKSMMSVQNAGEPPLPMGKPAKLFALVVRILAIKIDADHQAGGGEPFTTRMTGGDPLDLPATT